MKKLIFSFVLFCAINLICFAQGIDFEVKIDSLPSIVKGKVTITVTKGEPDYVFMIASDAPWKGGNIIKESAVLSDTKYTFDNLSYGRYFILVRNKSNEKASYQYINIPTSK